MAIPSGVPFTFLLTWLFYPLHSDIENCLLGHPLISECSVVGLSHEVYGQTIAAVVVKADAQGKSMVRPFGKFSPFLFFLHCSDQSLTLCLAFVLRSISLALAELDLDAWCADVLAPYQRPTTVHFVDEIPKNAMGKVNKKKLAQWISTLPQ